MRFLNGSPRCLVVHGRQAEQQVVDVFSDSDWAGCTKTRPSTSFSYVMLGGHLIASSATTQNVVATSSGEAEFYALTKSASRALGAVGQGGQATCTSGRHGVESDSLAARSGKSETRPYPSLVGASGGGPPRADHRESAGCENPADSETKHLAQREMHECMGRAGCHIAGGRSRLALRQPEFRVHRGERAWIQKNVEVHAAQVVRRCFTK